MKVHKRIKTEMSIITTALHDIYNEYGKKAEDSNLGYNLSYKLSSLEVEQHLPGLMYAHNIGLLADSQEDL